MIAPPIPPIINLKREGKQIFILELETYDQTSILEFFHEILFLLIQAIFPNLEEGKSITNKIKSNKNKI